MSPVAEIAHDFGMKQSSVTMLLLRTRKKLQNFLEKEGFSV
jgi:DNA-directed RNA polymerase specialized sigma24 family protein